MKWRYRMYSVCMKFFLAFVLSFSLLNGVYAADESKFKDSEDVFNFAEKKYPQYFSPAVIRTDEIGDYWARYYPETDIYIGTLGDEVYVLGKVFGGLLHVGNIASLRPLGDCIDNTGEEICASIGLFSASTALGATHFIPGGNCSSSFPKYTINAELSKNLEKECAAGSIISCGACGIDNE